MSDFYLDIHGMNRHFGTHNAVNEFTEEQLKEFYKFRLNLLLEEFQELVDAKKAEDAVDALIDITVVALGTLDLMRVDVDLAWQEVHKANMKKEVGVKPERPNPLNLPDLKKPFGWKGPSHYKNTGKLWKVFKDGGP